MKRILDISEVVGRMESPGQSEEICATADAQYDETSNRLVVQLDSFVRSTGLNQREEKQSPTWLPKPTQVLEHMPIEEAHDAAREIFHRWVRKLTQATQECISLSTLK